jgi:hypothetical protein
MRPVRAPTLSGTSTSTDLYFGNASRQFHVTSVRFGADLVASLRPSVSSPFRLGSRDRGAVLALRNTPVDPPRQNTGLVQGEFLPLGLSAKAGTEWKEMEDFK